MAKIISFSKWIDDTQETVYPITHERAVLMADGVTRLSAYLTQLESQIQDAGLTEEEVVQLIKDEISAVVGDNVDEAFDTLKEIADWILEHNDEYENIILQIGNKVDKETGKGLSTNDYTNADKAIVDGVTTLINDINAKISALKTADIAPSIGRQYVTEAEKTKISAAARVLVYTDTFPADAVETDLVMQIVGDV